MHAKLWWLRSRVIVSIALTVAIIASVMAFRFVPLLAATIAPPLTPQGAPAVVVVGANNGGTAYQQVGCTPNGDGVTCSLQTVGGTGSTTFPYSGLGGGQTATATSFLGVGGIYNTSAPTLTNGQFGPTQLDASANLKVNCITGCSGSPTFPYSGTVSGQTAATGSFLGAGGIYNSGAPTLTSGQFAPIQLDVSGNQKVNCVSGCSGAAPLTGGASGVTAAANQSIGLAAYNGTTMDALKDTIVGNALNVGIAGGSIANTSFGISGTLPAFASTPAFTISGTPAFTISGTLPAFASTPSFNCASGCGATTFPYSLASSGQTATTASGLGAVGVYNSSAPTLTNGQAAPIQLDTNGYLKVNVTNAPASSIAVTLPYSGTSNGQTAQATSFGGDGGLYNSTAPTITNGQYAPLQTDSSGNLKITGGGATRLSTVTLTTNAVTAICSASCTAFAISAINTTGTACYLQEFNTVAGSVTLGTTAPVRIVLLPSAAESADNIPPSVGITFGTAWSFAVTTTPTGSTACGSTVYAQADYKTN